ncbi:MAG: CBS domain-containing protein, partial [Ktedonobacterales bacterium]
PVSAPANISLQRLVDEYILPLGLRAIPVVQAGRPVGVISLNDLRKVPRDQWEGVPVGHVMTPIDRIRTVAPQQPIADILPLLADGDVGLLPVVENDTLVGILSREAIVHAVDVRRNLGIGGRVVNGSAATEGQPSQSPATDQWPGNAPT